MLADARRYFITRNVLEVETPILSRSAVSDRHIESVGAKLKLDPGRDYFLHTSPEFCMKRLLAAGFPDIAQICRVFRDGEAGSRHQPEFTMIEWYRLGFDLDAIMRDAESCLATLLGDRLVNDRTRRMSYREAFVNHVGIDPRTADIDALAAVAGADDALRRSIGDDRDAWLDLVMASRVATRFESRGLTVVFHYPLSQAALARPSRDDASVADRFEIFCGSLELANGYVELTDPLEQQRRFNADQAERRRRGARTRPLDEELMQCLEAGLPECAGVAVGFDRLLMIASGVDDIRQVQHFPYEGPE